MVLSFSYRRPDYVPRSRGSNGSISSGITDSDGAASIKSMPVTPKGIPEALSFDRIVNGGTCPPCTKRDFLNYLKYIERAPENLQFFLWFKDYEKRFNESPESEKVLAPEWTPEQAEVERKNYRALMKKNVAANATAKELFKGSAFEEKKGVIETKDDPLPFEDRSSDEKKRDTMSTSNGSFRPNTGFKSIMSNHTVKAENAFNNAGMARPFTIQPFRDEISRVLTVYIIKDAPRQLNLSGGERHAILKALEYTTNPSAFREIANTVEYSLRQQAHPNFIRWTICNGNRPRVIFARGLGIFLIVAGVVTDILITLSRVGRGWRVLPIILLILGVSTLIAAWKGMCVVLHGLHHQHVRPWELFMDDEEAKRKLSSDSDPKTSLSIESLTSSLANSFEDEPWVGRYKRRNVVRKIFDRERWIKEPALRQIQDTIFLQAILGATLVSAVIVAIFVAVPAGRVL